MYGRAEGVWQVGAYGWFLAEALEKTSVVSEKAFSRLLNLVPLRFFAERKRADKGTTHTPRTVLHSPRVPHYAIPDSSNPGTGTYTDNTLLEKFLKRKIL